jgi:hypothetical protein
VEHLSSDTRSALFWTEIPCDHLGWAYRTAPDQKEAGDVQIGPALGNKRRCEPVVNYEVIKEMNKYIVKNTRLAPTSLASSHCSGAILVQIRRAALLAVALGATAVLATGCSSTGTRFNASLISPVPVNQQATAFENGNWYQPSRSPGFDSDLFGG